MIILLSCAACGSSKTEDQNLHIQLEESVQNLTYLEIETRQLEYEVVKWLPEPSIYDLSRYRYIEKELSLHDFLEVDFWNTPDFFDTFGRPHGREGSGIVTNTYVMADGFGVRFSFDSLLVVIVDPKFRTYGLVEAIAAVSWTEDSQFEGEHTRLPLPISSHITEYRYINRNLALIDMLEIDIGERIEKIIETFGEPNGFHSQFGMTGYFYEMSDGFWVKLYIGWDGFKGSELIIYNIEIIDLKGRRFIMFWDYDPSSPPEYSSSA